MRKLCLVKLLIFKKQNLKNASKGFCMGIKNSMLLFG